MHSCATATGLVAIENNGIGDMVLAANEETGEVAYKEVVRTFVNTTDEITHVTVNVGDGVLETIDSTPEHPFCVEGKGWVEASSLHAGMTIWFANGTKGTVEDITNEGLEEPVTVYNFEVKDFHTYFVGYSGILVHNANCGNTSTNEIPWSSKNVKDAASDLQNGANTVTVKNRSEAEELFLGLYQGDGYTNTTGMNPMDVKEYYGNKAGTYHWDDTFGEDGCLLDHGPGNRDSTTAHLQIHPEVGNTIRIFFGTEGGK